MEPLCACGYCLLVEPATDEAGVGGEGGGGGGGSGGGLGRKPEEVSWAELDCGDGGLGIGWRWGEVAMVLQYTVRQRHMLTLPYTGLKVDG